MKPKGKVTYENVLLSCTVSLCMYNIHTYSYSNSQTHTTAVCVVICYCGNGAACAVYTVKHSAKHNT